MSLRCLTPKPIIYFRLSVFSPMLRTLREIPRRRVPYLFENHAPFLPNPKSAQGEARIGAVSRMELNIARGGVVTNPKTPTSRSQQCTFSEHSSRYLEPQRSFCSMTIIAQRGVNRDGSRNVSTTARDCVEPISMLPNGSKIIDVSILADEMREEVRKYTKSWKGRQLRLVGIMAHNDLAEVPEQQEERRGVVACPISKEHTEYDESDDMIYAQHIANACEADGIAFELIRCSGEPSNETSKSDNEENPLKDIQPEDVERVIRQVNNRNDVDGIIVFYPIFQSMSTDQPPPCLSSSREERVQQNQRASKIRGPYKNQSTGVFYKSHDDFLRDIVDKSKDVEGFCTDYHQLCSQYFASTSISALTIPSKVPTESDTGEIRTSDAIFPCTALSVKQILDRYHLLSPARPGAETRIDAMPWSGQTVSIVNRSEILGRPLAAILASSGESPVNKALSTLV